MAGSIFLPYQARWSKDRAQVKIWEKSRRIGASYGAAADAVLHAAAGKRPSLPSPGADSADSQPAARSDSGGDVYYISYNKDMTQSFIRDCATWAGAFHQALGEIGEQVLTRDDGKDVHVFDIPFASGHHIQAFSNNPRNLRSKGRPGDWVIVDEAAFVDDLAELLKAAMAVTMWGGHVHLLSTHNGADNPFNALIQDVRAGRYAYSLHRTTLDDALADGLYRRICQVTGLAWSAKAQSAWREDLIRRYRPNQDEELLVIPAQGGGAYLPRSLIESCMPSSDQSGPLIRWQGDGRFNALPEPVRAGEVDDWLRDAVAPWLATLNPDRRHVAGWDFARSGDMTCLVVVELGADLKRNWRGVLELHNTPFAQQRQILRFVLSRLPRFSAAKGDATGNGADIAEGMVDAFGSSRVEAVKMTEATYREHFPRYKAGLEDRTTVLIRHDDVLEDHRAVQLVRGVPRVPDGKTDAKGQRHGDSAIAGLLADMAASASPPRLDQIDTGGRGILAGLGLPDLPTHADVGWGGIEAGLPAW